MDSVIFISEEEKKMKLRTSKSQVCSREFSKYQRKAKGDQFAVTAKQKKPDAVVSPLI